jgi:hypothetical protein
MPRQSATMMTTAIKQQAVEAAAAVTAADGAVTAPKATNVDLFSLT